MDALGTGDLLVQPFLGLVLGIVTLGAMCTQQGSDIGKGSFWMVIAPRHAKSRAVSQQQGRLAPPLTMRTGGHYILWL